MVTEVLTQEISSVSFAFYTPDEIKRLAVKKITSPILLDNGNNPIPDGPYDPALGPLDQYTPCATCHEKSSNCSGHFGYIELAMPVYNPLIFDILLKILKCACLYCHRFKYNREKITEICESYMHVKSGILYMCSPPILEKEGVPSDPATDTAWQHHGATSRQFVAAREIVKSFYTNAGRKCESCTAHVNTISADPSGKLFQHPLSSTHQTANLTKGLKLRVPTILGSVGELDAMFKEKRFLRPTEVKEHLRMLWENESQLCSLFWGSGGSSMFFLDVIAVTPNKFRPANKVLDMLAEHPQNIAYGRLIRSNMGLATLLKEIDSADDKKSTISLSRQFEMLCQELQTATNMLLDNTKVAKSDGVPGVRQLLEKKTGLFRWNMMGKRVNHTCRSVISPDPYIAVNEIGIPPIFAKHLTYPERVTSWNAQKLRQAVENGPDVHPGALFVEDEQGRKTNLNSLDKYKRAAVAKTLLSTPGSTAAGGDSTQSSRSGGKVVYRHMQDGDILLVNRQPTLHKPGIMAKKARVLQGERTLRMHYANCKTYNADFDGDEMNVHFPQDELGRAEAYQIVNANQQFTAPTSGEPLRGLIQDHIVSAVLMTKQDTFYTKAEYQQLVYSACVTSNRTYSLKAASALEICEREPFLSSFTPAILKPRELWTGKQVITTVLMHVTHGRAPYSFEKAGKVTGEYWGKESDELMVVVRDNDLLTGVIDKAQFDKLGLVHAFHELYGAEDAGRLLSIFSRLFTFHLQMYGFTCGMDDLLLVSSAEVERDSMLRNSDTVGDKVHASFVGCDVTSSEFNLDDVKNKVEKQLQMRGDAARAQIDTKMSSELNKGVTTNVNNLAIPAGLMKPFPSNCMCLMTVSGAKGGMVNFTQISTLLGQQDLEGKRVPRMISGKTLPCFPPWDTRPRAGGFVADRFLTGLRPQEYYFHCMAGRDGLVDTSVKTAVSGYLQRCLIKNLEGLRINYDFTVRDSDGSLVQFQYGEDGVNVSKISCLTEFELLAKNRNLLSQKLGYAQLKRGDVSMCTSYIEHVSEAFERSLETYLRQTPSRKRNDLKIKKTRHVQEFTHLMNLNYFSSLAPPGEPVGVLAGQSVGEPSTQMTLNTFHFAGRGEMNVTLGIPRLREILLSSSKDLNKKDIKTPIMTCPLKSGKTRKDAERIAALLKRISLADVLEKSDISIIQVAKHSGSRTKLYRVTLKFYPLERYPGYLNLTVGEFTEVVRDKFDKVFRQELKNEIKALSKSLKQIEIMSAASDVIAADEPMELDAEEGHVKRKSKKHQEFGEQEDDDDDDEDEGEEDGADAEKRRSQKTDETVYEDLEDEIALGAAEPEQLLVEEDITDEEDDKSDEVTNDPEVLDEPQINYPDAKNEKIRRGNHDESQNKPSDVKTKMRKARSSAGFNEDAANINSCNLTSNGLEFVLDYYVPQSAPHVFLPAVFDRSLKSVKVRSTPGIAKCSVIDYAGDAERPAIQTDGINFQGLYAFPEDLDLNKLETNSVVHTLNCYGVEAARSTIVREVQNVFKAYGISVSRRHLDLIADFMTFNGDYRQFNRGGMASSPSPFLKMSYETATRFLMDATLYRDTDDLATPSSRLVVGRPPPVGTGCFDLLQRVNANCEL